MKPAVVVSNGTDLTLLTRIQEQVVDTSWTSVAGTVVQQVSDGVEFQVAPLVEMVYGRILS